MSSEMFDDPAFDGDDLTAEAIEAAYQRALEAAESADLELGETAVAVEESDDGEISGVHDADVEDADEVAAADQQPAVAAGEEEWEADGPPVSPRQVLEALLFVGGEPLTGKRLADLLGGGFTHEQVDELLDELTHAYADQNRPYEVRLAEGGYRLVLRSEFERIRHRVYGLGPKEVKLSQDALEILALVAYHQPISKAEVEGHGKQNAGSVLRQLLRRELIALDRSGDGNSEVSYRTTERFLQLFGLRELADLPYPEDLDFK